MFQLRLKELREEAGLSQAELAKKIGVAQSTVGMWESGKNKPKNAKLERLANFFTVSTDYLLGRDSAKSIKEPATKHSGLAEELSQTMPANLLPVKRVRVPLLGGIAAGEPILADQQFDIYVESDSGLNCTYALRVDGDSMEPTVRYGDIVFIRQQEDVDDGRIAAVLIDDSATLKRVYHIPNGLQLLSDNAAKYPPMFITYPDHDAIRILGLAVAFKRAL